MVNFEALQQFDFPYKHWVGEDFLAPANVAAINAGWTTDDRWFVEQAGYVKKSALMFPHRLHPAAQTVATELYSDDSCARLSALLGFSLVADPWFLTGPLTPKVGGGLHEISRGGLLNIHVDFDAHPSGMMRAVNLLIYLNPDWEPEWGGALELVGDTTATIMPLGGTAVLFETDGNSWHGHPKPLACPSNRTRRSLALYYYRTPTTVSRKKTVYRR